MKLTKREKKLLYILLCVMIFVGGIFLLIMPTLQKGLVLQSEYQAAESQRKKAKAAIPDYSNLDEQIKEIGERLGVITDKYYGALKIEDVDKLITELSQNHNLEPTTLLVSEMSEEEIVNYEEYVAKLAKIEAGELSATQETDTKKEENLLKVYDVTLSVRGRISDLQTLVDQANISKTMKIDSVNYVNQGDDEKDMKITFKIYMM